MPTKIRNEITLSQEQMNKASAVAKQLHDTLRKRGVKDGHGLRMEDATAEMEAGGAAAELACSILLGVIWTAGLPNGDPKGPDVGIRTQVRSSLRPRTHHSLIIRPKDIEKYGDVPFVLVIQNGSTFKILGWIMAFEALKVGKLWNGGDSNRPDAWFVSQDLLNPIETLESA